MEKKLMFLASFMLVVFVKNSEGINCYQCTSLTDGCDDPIDTSKVSASACTGAVSCLKTKSETSGVEAVVRGCHTSEVAEGCSTADVLGISTETCYCNTDSCNPAVTTKLSTGLLVFVSLAYILCRVF